MGLQPKPSTEHVGYDPGVQETCQKQDKVKKCRNNERKQKGKLKIPHNYTYLAFRPPQITSFSSTKSIAHS